MAGYFHRQEMPRLTTEQKISIGHCNMKKDGNGFVRLYGDCTPD